MTEIHIDMRKTDELIADINYRRDKANWYPRLFNLILELTEAFGVEIHIWRINAPQRTRRFVMIDYDAAMIDILDIIKLLNENAIHQIKIDLVYNG